MMPPEGPIWSPNDDLTTPAEPRWVHLLSQLWDLVSMSFYATLFSLPVITIPAAWAALTGVARQRHRGSRQAVRSIFWRLFRENFWQATWLGWIFLLLGITAIVDVRLLHQHGWLLVALWFVSALYLAFLLQLFPLMVHMRMSSRHLVSTAFKLVFFRIHWTFLGALGVVASLVIASHSLLLMILVLPGGTATYSYWCFDQKARHLNVLASSGKPSTP